MSVTQQETLFYSRRRHNDAYFTHDSLLQTLQVLFSLLVALVQESERKSKDNTSCYLRTSKWSSGYVKRDQIGTV